MEIDGSQGEGGGQVLRTALTVAALTGEPLRLVKVRAGRGKPGLAPQHLTVVRALAAVCRAQVQGAALRATEITFTPSAAPQPGEYTFDVGDAAQNGSAGSVTLLAQSLIPALAFAPGGNRLILLGGTHVRWSPSFEYFEGVYLRQLAGLGLEVEAVMTKPGFYPVGGGRIEVRIGGGARDRLAPLRLDRRGDLESVSGAAIACNLPAHIPQRMTDRSRNLLSDLGVPFRVAPKRLTGEGPGAAITLLAESQDVSAGFTGYGERGKPSETVAEQACQALLDYVATGACVDSHLADQLLLPLSLIAGDSRFTAARMTGHMTTSARLLARLLPVEIDLNERTDGTVAVAVRGTAMEV